MSTQFESLLSRTNEVGVVVKTLQWMVEVEGIPQVHIGETVLFESGEYGYVSSLNDSVVEIVVLDLKPIPTGTRVCRLGTGLQVQVSDAILGTTVNVMGTQVRNWQSKSSTDSSAKPLVPTQPQTKEIDHAPLGIVGRKRISRQLVTGIVMVDIMIPIGCGQRELVMGDRKTGKSYLLWHAISTQAKQGTVCIYTAVGKKKAEIVRTEQFFTELGIANNTVIVAAALEESAGEIFVAPYTAMAIAEYFRDQGRDVLLVIDDMTTHAKFYRELSLISRKFPGRDSYPGDIFYYHSKLLERAGNFVVTLPDNSTKEVSITCLPVVETVQGDVTGYIQTNVMSMTDGHIYFDSDLFFRGRRPAINAFISVTRVGRQTQGKLMRDTGRALFDLFNAYEKTQSFMRFGAELGENSRQILSLGDKVLKFFDQPDFMVVPLELGVVCVGLLLSGLWDGKGLAKAVELYQNDQAFRAKVSSLSTQIDSFSKLVDSLRKEASFILPKLIG